jgi:hypothetical protein
MSYEGKELGGFTTRANCSVGGELSSRHLYESRRVRHLFRGRSNGHFSAVHAADVGTKNKEMSFTVQKGRW